MSSQEAGCYANFFALFLKNCDQVNFSMHGHNFVNFPYILMGFWGMLSIGIEKLYHKIMTDKDITELWPFKVHRVSYSNVSCITDQRMYNLGFCL